MRECRYRAARHRCYPAQCTCPPQAGGGIRLRVEVYNQHLLAHLREVGTEVDGGGGLADTAFLVDESVDASHVILRYGRNVSRRWATPR